MISLETVRQTIASNFQTAHTVGYSTTLVNYPNLVVVDLERQEDPFVSVEIELERTPQAAIGEREILVHGDLRAYFYYRIGTGTSDSLTYADALNEQLGMQLLGEIYFQAVQTMRVHTFPGWEGLMCMFSFDVVAGIDC